MKRYVAFLRGINVSGQKIIKMDFLKQLFVSENPFQNVVTYIQSGNVVFDAPETNVDDLRKKIEQMLLKGLGYEVVTIVRSITDIHDVISRCPYNSDTEKSVYVLFLSTAPDVLRTEALNTYLQEGEQITCNGKEVFILTPKYGNSKLSNAFIEKKLGVSSTARNWATTNKVTLL